MDWRRGCAELMLLRGGSCDTASSWWFFRATDADKVVLTAVGHLPMWGRVAVRVRPRRVSVEEE